MDPIALTTQLSEKAFAEMLFASPRQAREVLFSRFAVKPKKLSLNPEIKRLEKARLLQGKLKAVAGTKEADLCRELIRNWLYSKRPMLKSAMDFLGVANDNGLVDTEEDFFKNISESKINELYQHLIKEFDQEEVVVYLRFLEAPHIEKVLAK